MSKGKSRSHNTNAELSFYSALDVEQAAHMLSELQSPHLAVTVEPLDAETYRFELGSHLGVGGTVRGTVRHWEGTYTRIEATGDIVRDSDYDAHYGLYNKRRVNKQQNSLIGCFALIILPVYALFQLTSLPSWVFMLAALVSLSGMVMMYLMYGENDAEPEDHEQDKVHFRERDALLNTLIKAFQDAGVVAHKPEQLITKLEDMSLNDTLFKSKNT